MNVIARSFLSSLILAVLTTVALLTSTGYIFLTVGSLGLKQTKDLARTRGEEVGLALAQLAGERFDSERSVKLSSVMGRVVEISESRFEDFVVNEIFMIDVNGRLLAHSDIALMAEETENPYTGEQYESALGLAKRNPSRVTVIEEQKVEAVPLFNALGKLSPALKKSLAETFPEKVTTRYHVGVAVFPVDQDLPAGSIHMFISVKTMNQYVAGLRHYSMNTLLMVTGFVFFISLVMILLLSLTFRDSGEATRRARTRRPPSPRTRAVLDEEEDQDDGILARKAEPVSAHRPTRERRSGPRGAALPDPEPDPLFASDETPSPAAPDPVPAEAEADYEDVAYEDDTDAELFIDSDPAPAGEPEEEPARAERRSRAVDPDESFEEPERPLSPYAEEEHGRGVAGSYRSAERIMDAIPLDRLSRNKGAAGGGNRR